MSVLNANIHQIKVLIGQRLNELVRTAVSNENFVLKSRTLLNVSCASGTIGVLESRCGHPCIGAIRYKRNAASGVAVSSLNQNINTHVFRELIAYVRNCKYVAVKEFVMSVKF